MCKLLNFSQPYPHLEDPEDIPFSIVLRNAGVTEAYNAVM